MTATAEWLEPVLFQALAATLLAVVAAVASRFVRRPAIVHLFWLLVLVKLLTPPLLGVGLLPRPVAAGVVSSAAGVPADPGSRVESPLAQPTRAGTGLEDGGLAPGERDVRASGFGPLFRLAWAGTVLLVLTLAGVRLFRFHRLVRQAGVASEKLRRRVERCARRLGGRRVPEIRMLDGTLPPMVWAVPGRSMLLLPSRLISRLTDDELETILVHELAHLGRRDPWIRWLELIAMAAYGWLPTFWWARRRLRAAEERACDALVLRRLPGSGPAYARALLKTVEFLAGRPGASPLLASGAGDSTNLKERMKMILERTAPRTPTRLQRILLAAIATAALLVSPTWVDTLHAQEPPAEPAALPAPPESATSPEESRHAQLALERAQLAKIEAAHERERAQYVRQLAAKQKAEQNELRQEADRLRAVAEHLREREMGPLTDERRRLHEMKLHEAQRRMEEAIQLQHEHQFRLQERMERVSEEIAAMEAEGQAGARRQPISREARIAEVEAAIAELTEQLRTLRAQETEDPSGMR